MPVGISAIRKTEQEIKEKNVGDDTRQLTDEAIKEVREAFFKEDPNKTGLISLKQYKKIMESFGQILTDGDMWTIRVRAVKGKVNREDYTRCATYKFLQYNPYDDWFRVYDLFDYDGTGKITYSHLRRLANNCRDEYSNTILDQMIEVSDEDQDGGLNLNEFMEMLKRIGLVEEIE